MGTYCTTTSLQTVMAGVTFNTATTSIADKCIEWAEAEINKHLSTRYDLTASTFNTSTATPPMVRAWCEQLSEGYLEQRLARGGVDSLERGEKKINPVLANLKSVSEGLLSIADTSGSLITDSSDSQYAVSSNTSDYAQTFDVDTSTAWEIDSDRLDDVDDGRD